MAAAGLRPAGVPSLGSSTTDTTQWNSAVCKQEGLRETGGWLTGRSPAPGP